MDLKSKKKKLLIVDAYALIYRAYHAVPSLSSKGRTVNATYGFFSIFLNIFNRYNPDYIICTFDSQTSTVIKKKKFSWYKANRDKVPEDLIPQFSYVKDILNAFNINIVESIDYEADDLVASLVNKFQNEKNLEIYVITGDKDLIQLVNENVLVIIPGKSFSDPREITSKNVKEFLGFDSKYLLSFKSLKGDPSDNIPGVPGVGDKTAIDLILEYGDLDNIFANIENIKDSLKNRLSNNKSIAYESLEAAQLNFNVNLDINLHDLVLKFNYFNIISKLQEFDFNSLISKYFSEYKDNNISQEENRDYSNKYIEILNISNLDKLQSELIKRQKIFFHINSDNNSIFDIYFYINNKSVFCWKDLDNKRIQDFIRNIFNDKNIEKISFGIKEEISLLEKININLSSMYFDINLAYFILKNKNLSLKGIIFENFNINIENIDSLTLNGKFTLSEISEESIQKSSYLNCFYMDKLYTNFVRQFGSDHSLSNIFYNIDTPLIVVLSDIERVGIKIDTKYLIELNAYIKKQITGIESDIYSISKQKFNISSSHQLSNFLYQELNLPTFKKLKSGIFPTDELTLSSLSSAHPVIDLIRKYKELKKIETTYTLNLVKLVDENQRLHTTYNITGVSTGRLSSKNPNLQNIPNKTGIGKEIRRGFIAGNHHIFVSFDYSQIELRIMAHYSGDKNMQDAFLKNRDIHLYTASKIFNKEEENITTEERNRAKTINFGIIYGLSAYGLSQQLSISRVEATSFIDQYFETFPSIKAYYQYIDEFVSKNGFVETLFGRKRYFDNISKSYIMKNRIFREAINMPIQGTSADIIKISMNNICKDKDLEKLFAVIILQIHDELVFEVPENIDMKVFVSKISNIMSDFKEIKVPLLVDVKYGKNLKDLKKYE